MYAVQTSQETDTGLQWGIKMAVIIASTGVTFPNASTQSVAAQTSFTGSNQLLPPFDSASPDGYQKLPGGLIIQWGGTLSTNMAVTFPIAFPTACRSVVSIGTTQGSGRESRVNTVTATSFNLGSDACCVNNPVFASWIAIGY